MAREALLGAAVGKKGIGKTYTTIQLIESYVRGSSKSKPRKVLILDVNDEFTQYKALSPKDILLFSHVAKIEVRRIRPFNNDGRKMSLNEISDTLFKILDEFKNGLLLIEDINRYISDSLPNDLIGALCTNRHISLDIIMHFQSIGRITPKIWQNLNFLRFHKNSEGVDKHKKKFEDKHEGLKIVEILVDNQYYNGNERFHVTFDCDYEKIRGNYSSQMINQAIDEYIERNYTKIVKPLVNSVGIDGKKKYTPQSAMQIVKKRIVKKYLP